MNRIGMILVVVLVVIAALSFGAYTFSDLMYSHNAAAQLNGRQIQAESLVASGVDSIRAFLMQDQATQDSAGGCYDNASRFRMQNVVPGDSAAERGNYTVLSPSLDTDGNPAGYRYGLEDESSRLNLNALLALETQAKALGQKDAARNLLLTLPNMTADIADAILDWMDTDSETREYGAESDYYSSLSPPYTAKNGPLDTVEELLLVRGVTPALLFGQDANRNGMIDASESASGSSTSSGTSSDVVSQRGWASYLTLHSQERNVNSRGEPRINLNSDDLQTLSDSLSKVFPSDWVTYIIAYRQNGPYTGNTAAVTGQDGQLDLTQAGKTKFAQVLDLVGKKVQVKFVGAQNAVVLASPFQDAIAAMAVYMPVLMDEVSTVAGNTIPGRININQAPRQLLAGIPGLSEEAVNQIISLRDPQPSADRPQRRHETWLVSEGVVTLDEMRKILPFVCAGGSVFRAQVVGYFDSGNPVSRAEVILNAVKSPPQVLLWRNLSHLGRGYAVETLGVGLDDGQ